MYRKKHGVPVTRFNKYKIKSILKLDLQDTPAYHVAVIAQV